MTAIWREVVGFEGFYQVSSEGRVRSYDRVCRAAYGGSAIRKGRVLVPVRKRGKYLAVSLTRDLKKYQFSVHTLVAAAFIGPCPEGQQVCHGAKGRDCNDVRNLRYDTTQGNNADRYEQDGIARGERHGMAKLTEDQVRRIRQIKVLSQADADHYGVTMAHLWAVQSRRVWRHI